MYISRQTKIKDKIIRELLKTSSVTPLYNRVNSAYLVSDVLRFSLLYINECIKNKIRLPEQLLVADLTKGKIVIEELGGYLSWRPV